jgi:hypothetical protein
MSRTTYSTNSKTIRFDDNPIIFTVPGPFEIVESPARRESAADREAADAACRMPPAPFQPLRKPADDADSAPKVDHPYLFERDGNIWRLRFGGRGGSLTNSKGLRCAVRLLEKPNQPIDALVLEGVEAKRVPRRQVDDDVLTEEAKAEFKERLDEIQGEKESATNSGNDAEYERLEKEEEDILKQLQAKAGTKGRSRKLQAGNAAVAAHDRVEKAIKSAREKIAEAGMRELADHLKSAIKSEGVSFAYRPGGLAPEWKVSY